MPQLKDLKIDKVKFKKQAYTPWDISPSDESADDQNNSVTLEKTEIQTQKHHKSEQRESRKPLVTKKEDKKIIGTDEVRNRHILEAKKVQTENTLSTREVQSYHKQGTNLGTDFSFCKITGVQRKILLLMAELSKNSRSKITKPLSIEYIANYVDSSINTVKISIKRLKIREIIKRFDFQAGRNGWTKYELPDFVYEEIMQDEELNKLGTKPGTDVHTSSSNINTTTELSNEWAQINFDDLLNFGFSKNHIQQIAKLDTMSPTDLQLAIDCFVFDLQENGKASEIKKSPVEFFMGILRRQGFYTAPKNFEAPKDRALRLKLEQARQQQAKRQEMEDELIEVEFNDWKNGITTEEKDKILPEEVKNSRFAAEKESFLKTYFKDNYWLDIQQEKYADCFD